jgi:S-adenosyl methyltransferase
VAEKLLAVYPPVTETVPESRRFVERAVTWVAGQGITQFIDLGAGLPTSPNTHVTAQEASPAATVAYVDNDPVVISHLTALLAHHSDPTRGGSVPAGASSRRRPSGPTG